MKGIVRRGVIFCTSFLFIFYLWKNWVVNYEASEINEVEMEMSGAEKMEYWKSSPLWVEDQRPHINPHRFGLLINNAGICDIDEKVDLLVMVTSAVKHVDRRNAIRQTWGSGLEGYKTKLIFLLGQGRDQQSQIRAENEENRDIIQEDFEDSYHNLTLKTVMGLKWTSIFCPHAQFILKTDDDIYVNVPLLTSVVKKESQMAERIHGCIKNSPLNSPLPIPPEGFPPEQVSLMKPALPQFTAGAGYLIPGRFASPLYLASLETKLIPVEDAYTTGFCAKKIGLHPPTNDPRFSCGQLVQQDCQMSHQFTGHKVTPERMWAIHEKLMNNQCGLD